jgi:DNA-binding NtrC family response regulator
MNKDMLVNLLVLSENTFLKHLIGKTQFNTLFFENPEESMQATKSIEFDVAIVDYNQETEILIKWLRNSTQTRILPIIIINKDPGISSVIEYSFLEYESIWVLDYPLGFEKVKKTIRHVKEEGKIKNELRENEKKLQEFLESLKRDVFDRLDSIRHLSNVLSDPSIEDTNKRNISNELLILINNSKRSLLGLVGMFTSGI